LAVDTGFEFDLHLIRVPPGEETFKITVLQFLYKIDLLGMLGSGKISDEFHKALGESSRHFMAVPNSLLSLTAGPLAPQPTRSAQFKFAPIHRTYKALLNLPAT